MVAPTTLTDISLDTTNTIISALLNAAKLSPVPFLQNAAKVALNITECIQRVRSNKEAFKRLSDDACALVYILLCTHGKVTKKKLSPSYLENTKELQDTLEDIHKYAETHASKRFTFRIVQFKSDPGTIQEFRERLKHSLDVFGLRSSISIQDSLAHLDGKMDDLQTLISEIIKQEPQLSTPPTSRRPFPTQFSTGSDGVGLRNAAHNHQDMLGNTQYQYSDVEGKVPTHHEARQSDISTSFSPWEPSFMQKSGAFPFQHSTNVKPSPYYDHFRLLSPSSRPYLNPSSPSFSSDLAADRTLYSPSSCATADLSPTWHGTLEWIGGNHNVYFNSPVNSSSGNITTTTISNSHNSFSSR